MRTADAEEIDELLLYSGGRAPMLAILDSGLEPLARLPAGTQVVAARSFVDGNPWHDPLGWGTGWAVLYARAITARRGPEGRHGVKLVIAQVLDRHGNGHAGALARGLAWAAQLGAHAYVAPWVDAISGDRPPRMRVIDRRVCA